MRVLGPSWLSDILKRPGCSLLLSCPQSQNRLSSNVQATTINQYEMEDEPLFIESLHENSEKASLILRDDIYNVRNKRPASRSYVECWQRKKEKKWLICYLYPRKEDSWPESSGETS